MKMYFSPLTFTDPLSSGHAWAYRPRLSIPGPREQFKDLKTEFKAMNILTTTYFFIFYLLI